MTIRMAGAATVLLVEDNDVDREQVRRAFARHRIRNPLIEAGDGTEALNILRGAAGHERLERPFLLLLDLALPRIDGLTLLKELRADPVLNDTVIFVLTTSKYPDDVRTCYAHQVAGYLVKGEVGDGMSGLVELLHSYDQVVQMPTTRA